MRHLIILGFVRLLQSCTGSQSACEDIDPNACVSMAKQNPNMCSDAVLATSVCPKHCDQCNLICYSGIFTMDSQMHVDSHQTNTITCASGEVCWLSETSSDHTHRQFRASCGNKQCNHTSKCCFDDLCNTPHNLIPATTSTIATTTITRPVCNKNIVFVVDHSPSMEPGFSHVKDMVTQLIDLVPIGDGANSSISFYAFTDYFVGTIAPVGPKQTTNFTKKMVSYLPERAPPVAAINNVGLHMFTTTAYESIQFYEQPNVAVFISASTTPRYPTDRESTELLIKRLHVVYHNTVSIAIGNAADMPLMSNVASDPNHLIQLSSLTELSSSDIVNKIYSLICN